MERTAEPPRSREGEAAPPAARVRPATAPWALLGLVVGALLGGTALLHYAGFPWMHRAPSRGGVMSPVLRSEAPVPELAPPIVQPKTAHPGPRLVRQLESAPVDAAMTATDHGIPLPDRVPLDPAMTYEVWTEGTLDLANPYTPSAGGAPPPLLKSPKYFSSVPTYMNGSGQTFLPSLPTNTTLLAIERTSSLSLEVLGPKKITVSGVIAVYPFLLVDRQVSPASGTLWVHVRSRRGQAEQVFGVGTPLYVDDDERLLVRRLDAHKRYRLDLSLAPDELSFGSDQEEPKEVPPATSLACVVTPLLSGETVSLATARGTAVVPAASNQFALAPGKYTLTDATGLWCTVPRAERSAGGFRLKLTEQR